MLHVLEMIGIAYLWLCAVCAVPVIAYVAYIWFTSVDLDREYARIHEAYVALYRGLFSPKETAMLRLELGNQLARWKAMNANYWARQWELEREEFLRCHSLRIPV